MQLKVNATSLFRRYAHILAAFIFTFVMYGIEEYLFTYPQFNYILQIYRTAKEVSFGATTIAISSLMVSFILALIFFYGFSGSPNWLRIIYVVIFVGTVVGEYGFQNSLQRFAFDTDVEIGMTAPVKIWLDAFKLYTKWNVLIPIILLVIYSLLIPPKPNAKTGLLSISIVLSLIFLQIFAGHYIKTHPPYDLNRGISPLQGINAVESYLYKNAIAKHRDSIDYVSKNMPDNNIVLIIDESLRGDHLSINGYHRPTTPYLESLSLQTDLFHNWGIAVPGATCSVTANGLLITGGMVESGALGSITSRPTIFQYAKAMGYKTIYMDAQTNFLWNGMGVRDNKYLDQHITSTDLSQKRFQADFYAAGQIREITQNSTGNFIVLNKRGVHFIYEDQYPEGERKWTPVPETTAEFESQPDLTINSYDNAILFNVDGFFKELFPNPDILAEYTKNTDYIYTSDHADSLFERGAKSDHCGGTKEESQVPLIIIGKLPFKVDTEYRASHSNIFPTILDLMKVPPEALIYEYNISLLQAQKSDTKDRSFFNSDGTIINHDRLP